MKIGIMTLWGTQENYGAVLQCYALQEYLRRNGHKPYLIRYQDKTRRINYKSISLKKIINKIYDGCQKIKFANVKDEPRYFDEFIDKYIETSEKEYNSYSDLVNYPPEADVYLVGSDQVWNFYRTPLSLCKDNIHAMFLDFGDRNIKRISYAASWDKACVSDEHLKEITPLINKLDYISVREKSGLELCYRCNVKKAEWVPDPTLLLKADDYRKLYAENKVRKIDTPYLLLYLVMTSKITINIDYVYDFAKVHNLKVIYVTENKAHDYYEKYYPSIPEWLYLVDHAQYVVTNSFHGTVFSILFHKQFVTIPVDGISKGTNNRIISLFESFGVENRLVHNHNLDVLDKPYNPMMNYPKNHFSDILSVGGGGANIN